MKMGGATVRVGQPYFSRSDIAKINSQVSRVLRSGWLTSGEFVADFERRFGRMVGTKYAVAVNSGGAALHTILSSLDLKPEDEVIMPANTFASTLNAVFYVGAKPVLADCEIETYNVSAETIEQVITPRTKAVIVTHIAGNPCEMDPITKLCRDEELTLIEDSAHAQGSTYKGKSCGSFGFGSAFSFYPTKVMTSAEGGMITTDSEKLYEHSRVFRNVGRAAFGHGPILSLGYNYRMSDIHATIGLNQLSHLRKFVEKRNYLSHRYREELRELTWLEPQFIHSHSYSSFYAYIVMLSIGKGKSRETIMNSLKRKDIETTVMFSPIHMQPYCADKFRRVRCPNAELIGKQSLALPLHVQMTTGDVKSIVRILRRTV